MKGNEMVKKIGLVITAVIMLFCICGCEAMNSAMSGLFSDKGKMQLGNYKGVEISPEVYETEVSDEDVENYIQSLIQQSYTGKEVNDRAVRQGDTVDIAYTGYINDETFEGGTSESYKLVIGSGAFIEGFEDGLIGADKGDDLTLELEFPQNYKNKELAGKPVVFEVTVNAIYDNTIPELTDEFARSNFNVLSADELRNNVRSAMESSNEVKNENARTKAAWEKVVSDTIIERYPQDEIDKHINKITEKYETEAISNGLSLSDYLLDNYGMSLDAFNAQAEAYAQEQVKNSMIVNAIAEQEGITLSDQEYDEGVSYYLGVSGYSNDEEFKADYGVGIEEFFGKDALSQAIMLSKVMQFVADNAVIKNEG